MSSRSETTAPGRRGALQALGSMMAVGVLGSCGGSSSQGSPTASSSPGASSATSLASTNAQCVVTPALTEGPYFVDELFFDEALTDQVHAQAPYSQKGRRDTLVTADSIFRSGGTALLVPLSATGGGYAGTMYVGVAA
jgi:hypothetical protein